MQKGNCLIAQSGGPTAAINATLCGAFMEAQTHREIETIYGGINGIEGVLQEKLVDLRPMLEKGENQRLLNATPASFLGSCRYKLVPPEKDLKDYQKLFSIFEKYNIRYFFYIGGNDSMDTVMKLDAYAKKTGYEICVFGLPKTIDNDLVCIDHTPGFGSSAKYIAASVKEIAADSAVYDLHSITIIEVMGRDAGWLAMSAVLAQNNAREQICDMIYLPEAAFSYEQFLADIQELMKRKKQIIVVISEGIRDEEGVFIAGKEPIGHDMFGHVMLGGAGKYLEEQLKKDLQVKVRSVELNVLQRCAAHLTSKTDIEESIVLGKKGVQFAVSGESGKMASLRRVSNAFDKVSNKPYQVEYFAEDIQRIANQVKTVPQEFINERKNHVTEAAYWYLYPLVQGEAAIFMEEGLPKHLSLADFIKE